MSTESTYRELVSDLIRIDRLSSIFGLLGWDEQVNLPIASASRRAEELAVLSEVIHRESTCGKIGSRLDELEQNADQLEFPERAVVREARRQYDRATKIPAEFVARKTTLASESFHAWVNARENSDFSVSRPHLNTQLQLAREEAGYLGFSGEAAYDYHIDQHAPGLSAAVIEPLFSRLNTATVSLLQQILQSTGKADTSIFKGFPEDTQESFLRAVTGSIGFDYTRGRIDRAVHPFCSGNGADTRMTTRFNVDNPLDSLFSSIHETGHGLYEQGLPMEHHGTSLGTAAGMAVHESQSRLWENQVGRSRPFWEYWEERLRTAFPEQLKQVSSHKLYLAINAVRPNLIRVDADEVTYNLHIIIRFDLERRMFSGDLNVGDLPGAWNEAVRERLGITPETDAEGCLQDVHWSGGAFGYFPSYSLGNMIAAQLWYTLRDDLPGLDDDFRIGKYDRLLAWLRDKVHLQGRQFNALELTRRVTGSELSPDPLIRYLKERYLPLYAG